jgi:acetyl-CoA acetyltransferase family protein
MSNERLAIIDGVRTTMGKAGGALRSIRADDLGALAVREAIYRSGISFEDIDEVILGNVAQPANAANIARVVSLKAGLSNSVPAYTVHRNCASGMESITTAAQKIAAGEANIIVAGGTESMSNIPLLYGKKMTQWFEQMAKSKTLPQKLSTLLQFRLSYLKPVIGVVEGLTDPICGLIMGMTAENLAKEFGISRLAQDEYALLSHQKTVLAEESGFFKNETIPVPLGENSDKLHLSDEGPRANQTLQALQKLKPYFDRKYGSVTVGNSCPLTDGAAAVVVMSESRAKAMGLTPLGYLRSYAYAGLEPERMGLGPVYATSKCLEKSKLTMKDIQLVELNEAFAVQVMANQIAWNSDQFAQTFLGRKKALGELPSDIINIHGGAIAMGHPVGMTGTRIVITLLKSLRERKLQRGLATLCVGGGQGASLIVEVE